MIEIETNIIIILSILKLIIKNKKLHFIISSFIKCKILKTSGICIENSNNKVNKM
jgi:hypothetical protein